MRPGALRSAVPALVLSIVVLVPFLGKAFTIDDTFFLFSAGHAISDPLHPSAFEINWDRVPERASRVAPTGPVMAWLLVPAILADGSERVAHLVGLLSLLVAIVATVALAIRLGLPPPWAATAGLLLVAMPAVLGMAGTAMPDVPAMAFGVAGVERLLAWKESARLRDAALSTLLLILAALTRSHLLFLTAVCAFLLVGDVFSRAEWTRRPWTQWAPLVASPLLVAVASIVTSDPDAGSASILEAAVRYSSPSRLASNTVAFSIHWVLAMAFALPWLAMRWRALLRQPWAFLAGSALAAFLLHASHESAPPYALAPVAGLGAAALFDVVVDAVKRRDGLQLALGSWLLVSMPALVYWHFPPKYLVASAPAAALLVARRMVDRPRSRPLVFGTVGVGALLGLAILRADARLAGVARDGAEALIAPNVAAGRNVWYVGHWGFQWYAEKAGARCWSASPPYPVVGDLIAYDENRANPINRRELEVLTHVGRIERRETGGRIMSATAGAGFYSNSWGYLPWAWEDGLVGAVDLWLAYPRDPGR